MMDNYCDGQSQIFHRMRKNSRKREKERKSFFRTIDFAYIATERGTRRNEIVDREKERGRERENGTKAKRGKSRDGL